MVTQRSAQFEPYFHAPDTLYYANVLCTEGCGRVIQEIWRKNLVSGQAEQLTLMNAIAQQPVVSPDGKWLVFSSDKAGNFHLWRMELATRRVEQLTAGRVTDISPAVDGNGEVYFIRRSRDGTRLMRRGGGREPAADAPTRRNRRRAGPGDTFVIRRFPLILLCLFCLPGAASNT